MAGIRAIKQKFISLDVRELLADSIEETKKEIVEYQKGQMLHGLNAKGAVIGKYKNKDYARKKANQNPVAGYGNVDLKLTGEFQRNIEVKVFSNAVIITSSDSKNADLQDKYGENIFGLSKPYAVEYSNLYLKKTFVEKLKQLLSK